MEAEVLKTVGQIAGIGGLALGVFLLLFRDIIRKQIFPQLAKKDAYRRGDPDGDLIVDGSI